MPNRPPHDQPLDWSSLASRLRRCAAALAGSRRRDVADDLVQETLARLIARGKPVPSYAYARSTLVRVYLDHERSGRRRAARAAQWALSRPAASMVLIDRPDAAGLLRAIERLSPMQRTALTLRLVEELSTEAVAEAMGTTPRAVRASLHTARSRLRAMLTTGGGE